MGAVSTALLPLLLWFAGAVTPETAAPGARFATSPRAPVPYREPGSLARRADARWRAACLDAFAAADATRRRLRDALARETARLPKGSVEFGVVSEHDLVVTGTYGHLPEVMVDGGTGAIFPMPLPVPDRVSWLQLAREADVIRRALARLEPMVERWSRLAPAERVRRAGAIARPWDRTGADLVGVSRRIRYLENWGPTLLRHWDRTLAQGERPLAHRLAHRLAESMQSPEAARDFAPLREALRPRRVMKRAYLPERLDGLPGGVLTLPIATDIADRRFRAEVEGAVVIHWNQSPWARSHHVTLRVRWTDVPFDADFAAGRTDITAHLKRFPADQAGMTTGGLTTQVTGQVMVLGPGRITPRTIAHELGHLLGFPDCYLRTLTAQGAFGLGGLAVLEWDNPAYPDDLMCDNNVGVLRDEVW